MISPRFIYPAFFLCAVTFAHKAFAQKEVGETYELSKEGMNARTDSFYFEAVKADMNSDESRAYALFEQFAALRPEVSDTWYELAKINYSDKKLDKAEENIKKAIDLNPGNKWYKEEYSSILADEGDNLNAAKIMGGLSESEPEDPSYLLSAAEYYERAKQYDKALEYLDKAITVKGVDEDILMSKVQVYLSMNNVEKAADMIRQLIEQDPENGKYYKYLGDLYDNNKLPAQAAEVYQQAEKIIPGDPNIQYGRAEHFLRLGDTASYITYLKKAILNKNMDVETQEDMLSDFFQSMPNDSVAGVEGLPIIRQLVIQHPADAQIVSFFGDLLDLNNKPDSAVAEYNRSLQLKSSIDVWRKLLGNFVRRQRGDSLVKYSDRFIRLYPLQVEPFYFNAQGYYLEKEYTLAIKAINRAIDNQPGNNNYALANLYAFMAEIYHAGRQDDFSDKAFEKALELDPDNDTVLNNYSYILSEKGRRLDDAEKMSRKSLAMKPAEPSYLDTYGWILYEKGDYEKAKTFVKRAIELSGSNADGTLFDHLGNIYFKLNDKDKAAENWKIAKEKGDDDPLIDKKISEGKLYE